MRTGLGMTSPNTTEQVVGDGTSGQYTLTYTFPVFPTGLSAVAGTGGTLTAGFHYYEVTAMTAAGETLSTNEAFAVTAGSGSVALSWTGVPGASSYRVYRGATSHGESEYLTSAGAVTSFTDTGLPAVQAACGPPLTSNLTASPRTRRVGQNH